MRIPVSYSIRNLHRRSLRSALTIAGIATVVFASIIMMSLSQGLFVRKDASGDDENLLLISRKGQNLMFSNIEDDKLTQLLSLPGVKKSITGELFVSPEIYHSSFCRLADADSSMAKPIFVRGVDPIGYEVHHSIDIVEGRIPRESFEVVAGATTYVKLGVPKEAVVVGSKVRFENRDWTVVGLFKSGGSMIESEIWCQLEDLKTVMRRRNPTLVAVGFTDTAAMVNAKAFFTKSGVYERYFKGWPEKVYYREYTGALNWVYWLSLVMVVAVSSAGILIGMNTMYTSIMSRTREITTQRILGFSKFDIACSFLVESIVLAACGGLLGVAVGRLIHNQPLSTSQGAFYLTVDYVVMLGGLALALVIGFLGAVLPLGKALRMGLVSGLSHGR